MNQIQMKTHGILLYLDPDQPETYDAVEIVIHPTTFLLTALTTNVIDVYSMDTFLLVALNNLLEEKPARPASNLVTSIRIALRTIATNVEKLDILESIALWPH
jgi:hypothetical protein